ncbi:DUF397 domain-containing protein [Streptomyces sp. NPDC087658]|uniref:DUF397 domain-containing protein n=1 Tax=Streptomyces sp. NPDC087658 TaxID=3365800 RepID=UPI0038242098
MPQAHLATYTQWRKSSYSGGSNGGGGDCLEIAVLPDGPVAIRDSKDPGAEVLLFSRTGMNTWLTSVKAGR